MELSVKLDKTYSVTLDKGSLHCLPALVKQYSICNTVAIFTDTTVDKLYGEEVAVLLKNAGFKVIKLVLNGGEENKTLLTTGLAYDFLASNGFPRDGFLLSLGGGVVGDITGFVAATYMRGVSYAQIPTTLLSMVDSCVGGKTGVNLPHGKNLIGCFYQPKFVLIDTSFLCSLPTCELIEGLSEVVKCAVVADEKFFNILNSFVSFEDLKTGHKLMNVIKRCLEIKIGFVEKDEKDCKERQLLNFGHTIGHGVEKLSGFTVSHGAAVAIGMIFEVRLGEKMGVTESGTADRISGLLTKFNLPQECNYTSKQLFDATMNDKKLRNGKPNLVLLRRIGSAFLSEVDFVNFPGGGN